MRVSSRGRACAVAAAAVLFASGGGFGIANVVAQSDPPPVIREDAGVLRVHLAGGGAASISYSGPLDIPASQTIAVNAKCKVTTTGALLTMTPSPAAFGLGMITNGVGVRTANNCSGSGGRISGAQTITLALGSAFGDDVLVDVAELDIEGKFNADLGVALDGGPVATHQLTKSGGVGNDTGVADNERVIVEDDFASIRLSSVEGKLSLEGGGDGTFAQYLAAGAVGPIGESIGSADTILQLVSVHEFEEEVDCEESIDGTLIGGSASTATFNRGLNDGAETPDDCEDIGATLQILDEGVLLDKSTIGLETGEPQAVNAQVTIEWTPRAAQLPMPTRQVNWEGDPDGVFENVQWCSGFDAETGWIHPLDPRFDNGVLPWCLIDDDFELLEDGMVEQVQIYDGQGDPLWK